MKGEDTMENQSSKKSPIKIVIEVSLISGLSVILNNYFSPKNELAPKQNEIVAESTSSPTTEPTAPPTPDPTETPTAEPTETPTATPDIQDKQSDSKANVTVVIDNSTPLPIPTTSPASNMNNSTNGNRKGKNYSSNNDDTSEDKTTDIEVNFDTHKQVVFMADSDSNKNGHLSIRTRRTSIQTSDDNLATNSPAPTETATNLKDEENETSTDTPSAETEIVESPLPSEEDDSTYDKNYDLSDILNISDCDENTYITYLDFPSGEYVFTLTDCALENINIYVTDDVESLCDETSSNDTSTITEPIEELQSIALDMQNSHFDYLVIPSYSFDSEIQFYSDKETNGVLEILDENYEPLARVTLDESINNESLPKTCSFNFTEQIKYYIRISSQIEDNSEHIFYFAITEQ